MEGTRVGVAVRLRPLLADELRQGHSNTLVSVDPQRQMVVVSDRNVTRKFQFDLVFGEQSTQEEVYSRCGMEFLIKKFVQGFNVTIFAYGQTGSGKTHTMEGYEYVTEGKGPRVQLQGGNERLGVIPRAIKTLFSELPADCSVSLTFLQLYKERIYDLLNPAEAMQNGSPGLKLRWNKADQFFVEDLSVHRCESASDVLRLYNTGLKSKIMASHLMNAASSRSHSLLTLKFEAEDSEEGAVMVSRLHLVDLAGSERAALTGNEGEALKESIDINKSLFTLRQVITQLSLGKAAEHIPYRDSKLTSLLKQSLGGNSYCLMVACLTPADAYWEENVSTLTYATKAASIANKPVKNLDPRTRLVKGLKVSTTQREVAELKRELSAAYRQVDLLSAPRGERSQSQASRHLPTQDSTRPSTIARSFDVSFSDFALSPELLTEKLQDSVQLVRELIGQNRQLRDTVAVLHQDKTRLEEDYRHVYLVLQPAADRQRRDEGAA
jgi:kinesin family protein 4/21/27